MSDGSHVEVTQDEIFADPERYKNQILSYIGYLENRFTQLFLSNFQNDLFTRDYLRSYVEQAKLVRHYFIQHAHKGKYVSDTGSPMHFDFLLVNTRDDFFANVEITRSIQGESGKVVITDKTDNAHIANPVQVDRLGDTLSVNLWKARVKEYEHITDATDREGIFLVGNADAFYEKMRAFLKANKTEMEYVLYDERHLIQPRTIEDRIRGDLLSSTPEEVVLGRYSISRSQLGGHKAALRRFNGWSPVSVVAPDEINPSRSPDSPLDSTASYQSDNNSSGSERNTNGNLNTPSTIVAESLQSKPAFAKRKLKAKEKREIAEFLADGSFSLKAIVEEYKISPDQVAGFLAAQTKRRKRLDSIVYEI